ncbi:protein of unknown function [Candidatus Filomicrobium marinum]|nr:protein of unknown function [Candidatus Filomicrobium marinum]
MPCGDVCAKEDFRFRHNRRRREKGNAYRNGTINFSRGLTVFLPTFSTAMLLSRRAEANVSFLNLRIEDFAKKANRFLKVSSREDAGFLGSTTYVALPLSRAVAVT